MREELNLLLDNETWSMTIPPAGTRTLSAKWVYRLKRSGDGEIVRYKARWVVKGFTQTYGIDYNETFASVVKPQSYKAIFAYAAALDWAVEMMDVATAFLYGEVEEEIYVIQPTGLEDGTPQRCRLKKALYRLKQAPRVWSKKIEKLLQKYGYIHFNSDLSVYSRPDHNIIIAIYVDDVFIASPSPVEIIRAKSILKANFKMVELGPCTYYLGMTVTRNRPQKTLQLGQQAYLERVLKQHGMWECKPVAVPMDTRLTTAETGYQSTEVFRTQYQSAVGSLMYAMLGTRPDIAFAVSVVSRYSSNPDPGHWQAVKRIFRYLRGTINLKLTYL